MKKLYSTIMMLAMMVAALGFTACGGDDEGDDGISSSMIVGTWKPTNVEGWPNELLEKGDGSIMQFKKDGSFIVVYLEDKEIEKGDWILRNDKLTMHYKNDGFTFVYDVIRGNKKELVLAILGMTLYLERISDSEINKYL